MSGEAYSVLIEQSSCNISAENAIDQRSNLLADYDGVRTLL